MIADVLWPGRWRWKFPAHDRHRLSSRKLAPNAMTADDPFHHLHDEDYARPFDRKLATAETLVTLADVRSCRSMANGT